MQNVYVSDTGNQIILKVNLADKSCIPFGWTGRYAGPGKFCFALHDTILVAETSTILEQELRSSC